MKLRFTLWLWLLPLISCHAADVESYYGRPVVGAGVLDIYNDKILFSDFNGPQGGKFKVITPYRLAQEIALGGGTVNWATPGAIGATTPAAGSFTTLQSSTPLGMASGGFGTVLVDPNADRILFWDDSAGAFRYLSPGTNLSITGTTLNAYDATQAAQIAALTARIVILEGGTPPPSAITMDSTTDFTADSTTAFTADQT